MQSLAVPHRQLKRPIVRRQDQDIPRGIQYRRADFAVFQMPLDILTQLGFDRTVDVLRDVFPHVFAVKFHSALPKNPLRAEPSFSRMEPGAFAASSARGAAALSRRQDLFPAPAPFPRRSVLPGLSK